MKWDVLCEDNDEAERIGIDWPPPLAGQLRPVGRSRLGLALTCLLLVGWLWFWLDSTPAQPAADAAPANSRAEPAGSQPQLPGSQAGSATSDRASAPDGTGGQAASLPARLWGNEQTFRSKFFTIHVQRSDGAASQEAVARLDERYLAVRRAFGPSVETTGERIRVNVGPQPGFSDRGQQRMQILSPVELVIPPSVTAGDVLVQSVQNVLVDWTVMEMLLSQTKPTAGEISLSMVNGLRLWGLWQAGGPLAESRNAQMRAGFLPSRENAQAVAPLCELHSLTRPDSLPVDFGLPCLWLARVAAGEGGVAGEWIGLPPISAVTSVVGDDSTRETGGSAIVLASLLEYATQTYGPGRLRLLLRDAGRYPSWQTLIPAVFDVSAEEFEAGWRVWLAEEYGL